MTACRTVSWRDRQKIYLLSGAASLPFLLAVVVPSAPAYLAFLVASGLVVYALFKSKIASHVSVQVLDSSAPSDDRNGLYEPYTRATDRLSTVRVVMAGVEFRYEGVNFELASRAASVCSFAPDAAALSRIILNDHHALMSDVQRERSYGSTLAVAKALVLMHASENLASDEAF